jgi:ADP-heptose:LPS heptosyltransferase
MKRLPDKVAKIAILRANAIGDFIVTLPAIHAIHRAYPGAELVLLGKPWHKEFLEQKENESGRTPIDRVLVIPFTEGLREEKGKAENEDEKKLFFSEAAGEKFDIVLGFHGKGLAANPFIKKLKPKFAVGLSCSDAESLDRSVDFYYSQSEIIRYLEVASLIDAKAIGLMPEIKILERDKKEAKEFLSKHKIDKYIVIHPGGTDIRRMWSEEKFANLADAIIDRGNKIIFTGSDNEKGVVESILYKMKNSAFNAVDSLTLGGLAGLLSASDIVISIDTGPLHLAMATGTKTVGLYWGPNLINWGPLTRAKHRPVVNWNMNCPQCGIIPNDPYPFEPVSENCNHNFSFIADIAVEDVLKEVVHAQLQK